MKTGIIAFLFLVACSSDVVVSTARLGQPEPATIDMAGIPDLSSSCGQIAYQACCPGDKCSAGLICNYAGLCQDQVFAPCGFAGDKCCALPPQCDVNLVCGMGGTCQ